MNRLLAAVPGAVTGALALALGGCTLLFDLDDPQRPEDGLVGTSEITWARTDGSTTRTAEDLSAYTISAIVADPAGPDGFRGYLGTGTADGRFSIAGLPDGPVLLELTRPGGPRMLFATDRRELDAGYVTVGRPDAAPATTTTPLALRLTGMAAWGGDGDRLQVTSFGAGTDLDSGRGGFSQLPTLGDRSLTVTTVDWSLGQVQDPGGAAARLADGAAGDDLWVTHGVSTPTMTAAGDAATLFRLTDIFTTTEVTMVDGGQAVAMGAFTTIPPTLTQSLRVNLVDWLAARAPSEGTHAVGCTRYAEPGAPYGLAVGPGAWSIYASTPPTGEIAVNDFTYANPMPAAWSSMVRCELTSARGVTLPDGITTGFAVRSTIDVPAGDLVQVSPTLHAPRDATLAGLALEIGGVVDATTGAPLALRWGAVPNASQYQVQIRRITTRPQGGWTAAKVATIETTAPAVDLPASLFDAETTYTLTLFAVRASGGLATGQLRRTGALAERAAYVTQSFTVRR